MSIGTFLKKIARKKTITFLRRFDRAIVHTLTLTYLDTHR